MSDTTISKCPSCNQEMRPSDYLERLRSELAAAKQQIADLETLCDPAGIVRENTLVSRNNIELLSKIIDLKLELAALLKTGGWIPVGERLPEDAELVQTWSEDYGLCELAYWPYPDNKVGNKEGSWWKTDYEGYVLLVTAPTHWMPLPLPPLPEAK